MRPVPCTAGDAYPAELSCDVQENNRRAVEPSAVAPDREVWAAGALPLSARACPAVAEGWVISWKQTRVIYCGSGLQLLLKTPTRRVYATLSDDRSSVTGVNRTRARVPACDLLAGGSRLRILTLIELFVRLSPVADPGFSRPGPQVGSPVMRRGLVPLPF